MSFYHVIPSDAPGAAFTASRPVNESEPAAISPWVRISEAEFLAALPAEPLRQNTGIVRRRMTDAEKEALHAAKGASWQIDYFVALADSEGVIDSSDPDFAAAVLALNNAGIILSSRWTELLAP